MASRPNLELDRHFMAMAIALGVGALGSASPNAAVGCVIVRNRKAIASGATAPGGRPHAETQALKDAGARARGATAYVSLEPCAHYGQTPPCARALAEAGVSRVVIGCIDPYPRVRGRGIAILKRAGIEVVTGIDDVSARRANEGFFTRIAKRRPLVLLKLAMTLDGRIASPRGDSKWISSAPSRKLVHEWRRQSDAVMVGAGTVIADNPRLTCRLRGHRDPARVVIDARLRTSPEALVFTERSAAKTILVTTRARVAVARRRYASARTEVIAAASAANGEISLRALLSEFGRRGWNRVMLEGGAHLSASALRQGVVDRVALFIAPKILGGGLAAIEGLDFARVRDSIRLRDVCVRRVGDDLLVEGRTIAG